MVKRTLTRQELERTGLPADYWGARIDQVPERLRGPVRNYLTRLREHQRNGVGLLVTGDGGAGKTTLAGLALKQARLLGSTCFFITVWDLREALRNRVPFEGDLSTLDRARAVDYLVLDGLRLIDKDGFMVDAEFLDGLVGERVAARKPTVVTTSLYAADLRDHFPGMMARFLGAMLHLHVTGTDHRRERAKELQKQAQPEEDLF